MPGQDAPLKESQGPISDGWDQASEYGRCGRKGATEIGPHGLDRHNRSACSLTCTAPS